MLHIGCVVVFSDTVALLCHGLFRYSGGTRGCARHSLVGFQHWKSSVRRVRSGIHGAAVHVVSHWLCWFDSVPRVADHSLLSARRSLPAPCLFCARARCFVVGAMAKRWYFRSKCPLECECSDGSWGKVKFPDCQTEDEVRSKVLKHLRTSGKHDHRDDDELVETVRGMKVDVYIEDRCVTNHNPPLCVAFVFGGSSM